MQRLHVHLTEKQKSVLSKLSQDTGLKVAELIRRAVDNYIKEQTLEYYNRRNMAASKGIDKEA